MMFFICIFSYFIAHKFISYIYHRWISILVMSNKYHQWMDVFKKVNTEVLSSWSMKIVCPLNQVKHRECQTAIVSNQMHLNAKHLQHFWNDRIKKTRINSNTNTIPYSILYSWRIEKYFYKGHFRVTVFCANTYFFHVVFTLHCSYIKKAEDIADLVRLQ